MTTIDHVSMGVWNAENNTCISSTSQVKPDKALSLQFKVALCMMWQLAASDNQISSDRLCWASAIMFVICVKDNAQR